MTYRNLIEETPLLSSTCPGRSFVAWYYQVSPSFAEAIRNSTALKTAVRAALLPAVGLCYLLLKIGLFLTLIVALLFIAAVCLGIRKLRLHRPVSLS